MKTLLFLSLLLVGCASSFGQGWSTTDTARQVAFSGMVFYDCLVQTPDYLHEDRELNPIAANLGEEHILEYAWGSVLLHAAISASLKPKYRKWWQIGWIGAEGLTIMHNWSLD